MPHIPEDIRKLYEVHNFRHAAEILATAYPAEFDELLNALRQFRFTTQDIIKGGGNESEIPKIISRLLQPSGWYETEISGDLTIKLESHGVPDPVRSSKKRIEKSEYMLERYLDGHKIDYVKNKVAFDLEWNSKDQTFDRDLYAFRTFFESGAINVAVLLTRSADLNPVFQRLGKEIKKKYGASTTWMGKLLPRLEAGRGGGCPVLALGMKPSLITDWEST